MVPESAATRQVRRQHRHRRRRHAGNAQRVAERVGPDLREPLNDLTGETRYATEREIRGNAPALIPGRALDLAFLAPQIPSVLHRRLEAREVEGSVK